MKAIADPSDAEDPPYVEGLYGAVSAAVEFGIAAVEAGTESEPPVPLALLVQARSAARSGVSLDTVLRRYFAGYSLLGYFLIEEANRDALLSGAELQRLLARQAVLFDHLLAAVGEEHIRETEALLLSSRQRRQAERIERLLEGELIDTAEIAYDFEHWHIGMVVSGAESEVTIRDLAERLDCRLLFLPREEQIGWAWLGARRTLDTAELQRRAAQLAPELTIAIGEPGEGLAGWRLTHRQAAAAVTVAQRKGKGTIVCYAEAAVLAAVLHDDLLADSLRQLYLYPLEQEADGGEMLRATLRAYFAHSLNVSSTAVALGLSRRTIARRLQRIEEALERPLTGSAAELEVALDLQALDGA